MRVLGNIMEAARLVARFARAAVRLLLAEPRKPNLRVDEQLIREIRAEGARRFERQAQRAARKKQAAPAVARDAVRKLGTLRRVRLVRRNRVER